MNNLSFFRFHDQSCVRRGKCIYGVVAQYEISTGPSIGGGGCAARGLTAAGVGVLHTYRAGKLRQHKPSNNKYSITDCSICHIFVSLRICYMQSGLYKFISVIASDQPGGSSINQVVLLGTGQLLPGRCALCTSNRPTARPLLNTGHWVTVEGAAAARPLLCTGYCPGWSLGNSSRSNSSQTTDCCALGIVLAGHWVTVAGTTAAWPLLVTGYIRFYL